MDPNFGTMESLHSLILRKDCNGSVLRTVGRQAIDSGPQVQFAMHHYLEDPACNLLYWLGRDEGAAAAVGFDSSAETRRQAYHDDSQKTRARPAVADVQQNASTEDGGAVVDDDDG